MEEEPLVIHIEPESDIGKLLESAAERPVVLEHNGVRFEVKRARARLRISERPGDNYNPQKALEGMRAAAGAWSDIDAEALKEYIYRAREEGSRPIDHP